MRQFGIFGGGFHHTTGGHTGRSSTHGKVSEFVEWVPDSTGEDGTFFADGCLEYGLRRNDIPPNRKYGWLIESKHIKPKSVEFTRKNHEIISEHYKFLFTHNRQLVDLEDNFLWVPAMGYWIEEAYVRNEKEKLCSMISSNKSETPGHKYRLSWAKRLRDELDLFGRGFNEIDRKEEGLEQYFFSVAIENGFYEGYFTEKLLDCFACGTIPVYKGAPDIGCYFDEDGIIDLSEDFAVEDLSKELYMSKLDSVKENCERVKRFEIVEDYIVEKYWNG